MPVPFQYDNAGQQFHQLLRDARDYADLTTTNQSYTMVQGVLLVFRRRLDIRQALQFADALPAVARAVFLHRWDWDEPILPFDARSALTLEVQAHRADHNYAPDTCISNVAAALRRDADTRALDECLTGLGSDAVEFWTPSKTDAARDHLEHPFTGHFQSTPMAGRPGSDRRPT
jgi:uncharacterized protein (DUF2267 family)